MRTLFMFLWPLDLIFDSGRMILVPFYRQRFRNVVIICINVLHTGVRSTIDTTIRKCQKSA